MNKTETKIFRGALERIQSELQTGSRNREALVVETSPDELDRIQHAADRDESMRKLERNTNRLTEVKEALHRFDAGTYGICSDCEEAINPKRLAAVPWAGLCITCQEAADDAQDSGYQEMEQDFMMAA